MKRTGLFTLAITMLYVTIGSAQQYPVMDMIANKVIQKYQTIQLRTAVAEEGQQDAALTARAECDPDAEERSQDACGVYRQDRRSHRQQDVRLRHDSVICDGIVPGGTT